ncbi:hypothetical protein ACZ11_11165 [Lysinibacillus xylanilyticus]|uniref:Uncharacterized protein n=1 Tax=Lysinibacillus xylanilyticus TaxID=582475 RepID=A0A0K9FES4_9BACI|nr:hypothetical protein [Lysinibacillus xylanilyticus]KMY32651.1 hypothetical protein ACZ11_11165 [Lysinibacillus xylanilyticus]
MQFIEQVVKGCLIVGIILMVGRIITAICHYYNIAFTTFFVDYHVVSLVILIIGIIGTEILNRRKKKGRA